jgi:hypothetical protein
MSRLIVGSWRQAVIIALLVGVDLALSLPIMGATCRPFSWMSIAEADVATLYPVIQNLWFEDGKPRLSVKVPPPDMGTVAVSRYALQRSTNLLNSESWVDVEALTATGQVIHFIDTNPVSRTVFYRIRQILGESP